MRSSHHGDDQSISTASRYARASERRAARNDLTSDAGELRSPETMEAERRLVVAAMEARMLGLAGRAQARRERADRLLPSGERSMAAADRQVLRPGSEPLRMNASRTPEMVIACPRCDARLDIPAPAAAKPDKKVLCPGCKQVFRLKEGKRRRAPAPAPANVTVADAPDLFQRWEVDRPDYEDSVFSLGELEDMVRRRWLDGDDRVRVAGTVDWRPASEMAELERAFKLRKKETRKRLEAMARKKVHPCANHARKRASHICFECARAFCFRCGNESEIRDQAVVLCVECDAAMTAIE